MSKLGHLTEQRKQFVEAYCRLGNGTLAAREAGYKDTPSLANQASKLKRELSVEIAKEFNGTEGATIHRNVRIREDLDGIKCGRVSHRSNRVDVALQYSSTSCKIN